MPQRISARRIRETDTYDAFPSDIISLPDDELLVVYRRAEHEPEEHLPEQRRSTRGHVSNHGRVVANRSRDDGKSWSDAFTIANHQGLDTRNQSVVYSQREGRLVVFYWVIDAVRWFEDRNALDGVYYIVSDDYGRTWSSPTEITDKIGESSPYGGGVETTDGLFTTFYNASDGRITGLFSGDDGRTWSETVTVCDSGEHRSRSEPHPVSLTENRLMVFGRDSSGDFWCVRSVDGGDTWEDPVEFNIGGMQKGVPIWVKPTGPNELTAVWGDRTNGYIFASHVSAHLAWQDPSELATRPRKPIHKMQTQSDATGDFGYPTFAQLGTDHSDILITFYDGHEEPDIYTMNLY